MAKCPHCEKNITKINLQEVTSSTFMGMEWVTILYCCPLCQKVLNAQIDPIAIMTETVARIKRG